MLECNRHVGDGVWYISAYHMLEPHSDWTFQKKIIKCTKSKGFLDNRAIPSNTSLSNTLCKKLTQWKCGVFLVFSIYSSFKVTVLLRTYTELEHVSEQQWLKFAGIRVLPAYCDKQHFQTCCKIGLFPYTIRDHLWIYTYSYHATEVPTDCTDSC